jgi:uncharacterized protein (TIRG00374 family)
MSFATVLLLFCAGFVGCRQKGYATGGRLLLSSKLIRQALLWIAVCIAVYGVVVVVEGWDDIAASLKLVSPLVWGAVIAASSLNILIRFGRWQYYLKLLGHHVAAIRSLTYMLCGFAFTSTPAKAGEAVRSLYLKQHGVSYTTSLAALFVERLTDLLAVVLLAMMAALVDPNLRWPVIAAMFALLLCLPLVHSAFLQKLLTGIAAKLGIPSVSKAVEHLLELLQSSAGLLRSGPLYFGMLLSMAAAFAVSVSMYLVLTAMGVEIPLYLAIGIYATGILAGALSFLPGGIGSAELVMLGLLLLAGVDKSNALAAILICRVGGLWYPLVLGMTAVLGVELSRSGSTISDGEAK